MAVITTNLQDEALTETIANRVSNIPLLSHVASQLLAILGGSDHSMQDVVKIVETDISLTAQVLRVANSAAFYRGQDVTTVSNAILNLGEKMVTGVALGSCASRVFNSPLEGYESPSGELWNHSLRTAIASREIAAVTAVSVSTDIAFTAGLLHDIGKSIISEFLIDTADEMLSKCDNGLHDDFLAAEKEQIGTDHAMIGYKLACHWNLPEPISAVILNHHHPNDAEEEYKELVYIVHIGDILAMMGGTGTGIDTLFYKIDERYEEYISMQSDSIPQILLTVQEEFERTKTAVFSE